MGGTGKGGAGTGEARNGEAANDGAANDGAANDEAANGGAANGGAASSEAAKGEAANSEAANGEAANGEAANGEAANGGAANSEAGNGEAANSEAANGGVASSEAAKGEAGNGDLANGEAANGGAAIGPLMLNEVPALLAAWNRAFGGGLVNFEPRTLAAWEARFAHNPAGLRSMVARDGEDIICQYAADPQRARLHGEEVTFAQVVDTFVSPDLRGGLAGARLFLRTARAFFAEYGAASGDVLYYGWPVPAARRLGVAQLEYTMTDRLLLLGREVPGGGTRDCGTGPPNPVATAGPGPGDASRGASGPGEAVEVWGAAAWPELATEKLFEACTADWDACVVRDSSWFKRRFQGRPGSQYQLLSMGEPRSPRALAVLRHGDWPLANTMTIVDWLVPPHESEAGELLAARALDLARAAGAAALVTHFPPRSVWFERFQAAGYSVHATDLFLVTRPFLRRLEPIWLRDHLWLQLSDTDLV
ncbi:MAG: hypothetical protein CMJ87_01290 [Planctomycetes bacterium]|jgi:hypothetical protein|nr:hypothetical protein [Planctomycetota bacterium]